MVGKIHPYLIHNPTLRAGKVTLKIDNSIQTFAQFFKKIFLGFNTRPDSWVRRSSNITIWKLETQNKTREQEKQNLMKYNCIVEFMIHYTILR